jgi:DNA repair exonuclease SbcCD ATPase subunit
MKLRSITLSDVRQFSRPVIVAGIGDGLNVLSAPNESGKSTLFDAIQALFFVPHRSTRIGPLRPDIGGNPEITLEIEHDGALHRLHKRWGRGALAEVTRSGRIIAKGDEAEAFIAGLTLPADEGGPAGLLWVRQGLTALDEGSSKEQKAAETARRDLMSSVTGEFEALTGGKRMDRALARARAERDALVTQRGARAGGALDTAQKQVKALQEHHDALSAKAARLREALDQRRHKRRTLEDLSDPVEARDRTDRLTQAQTAFAAAERHAEALRATTAQMQAATLARDSAAQQIARRARLHRDAARLAQDLALAADLADQTSAQAAQSETALQAATRQAQDAHTARRALDQRLNAALRAAARQSQQARHADLSRALTQAEALATTLPSLRQAAALGPDALSAQAIDDAQRALQLAEGLASAAAPRITLDYASPDTPRATLDGAPLTPETPIPARAIIDLPGYGRLTVDPGRSTVDPRQSARARDALADLLARFALPSTEAARAAARTRQAAEAALREALADLKRLAPDGVEALRAECARIAPDESEAATEDPETAQSAANAGARAAENADLAVEAARARRDAAAEQALRARVDRDALQHRQTEAQGALDDLPDAATLAAIGAEAEIALAEAVAQHAALASDAPDLQACRVTLDRARAVLRQADEESMALKLDLARLDTEIDTQAGDGVDEDLADTALQLGAAQATLAAQEHEVAVLLTLIEALETAQSSARDRYFAPVLAELRPMLRLLWPDAELQFDGDSLLPSALVRDGSAQSIGSLSGGTREQIALLVRLAFARLLAKNGQHAPVILDDALVYTDDDRIERMFDALHAQAGDLQILVLSCRNRALRALGGRKLTIESVAADA